MSETPERHLANRIVEDFDLIPPVDVLELTKSFADIVFVEWPYQCDGLTIDLTTTARRPKVFIKETRNVRRQRFTIAHELGHVILPWHIEGVACAPEAGIDTCFSGGLREREASTFASHILVPDRFIHPMCQGDVDVPDLLGALASANISVEATLIATARALPPGFAFVLDSGRIHRSDGTILPCPSYDSLRTSRMWTSAADQSGKFVLGRKTVRWFKFERFEDPLNVDDVRSPTQILLDAIATLTDDESERKSLQLRVNGVIGAAMTSPESRTSPARALAVMRHRIRGRPDLVDLVDVPDFELFLHKRAAAHGS